MPYEHEYQHEYEVDIPDEEEIIDEFLGENPRAHELAYMRRALERRRNLVVSEIGAVKEERVIASLKAKVIELEKQIQVIRDEESITDFVESSVRIAVRRPALDD